MEEWWTTDTDPATVVAVDSEVLVDALWTIKNLEPSGRYRADVGDSPQPTRDTVEVRRSRRRRSTVTAYRDGERTVVLIPARFTASQEREWVGRMLARLSAQERRRRPGDAELLERALGLSARYLGGLARPQTVAWVANQNSRWGSCTPADGTIRLSSRLMGMPGWVIDYVLLHELAHLIQPGHGPRFWSLLQSYGRTERARGFLEGFAAARDLPINEDDDEPDDDEPDDDDPEDGGPDGGDPGAGQAEHAHGVDGDDAGRATGSGPA